MLAARVAVDEFAPAHLVQLHRMGEDLRGGREVSRRPAALRAHVRERFQASNPKSWMFAA